MKMLIIILIVALTYLSIMESNTITKENAVMMEFTNAYDAKSHQWHYTNGENGNVALLAMEGDHHKMYDRFFIDENFDNTNVSLYAIFDGDNGSEAAQYAIEHLMPSLKAKIKTSKDNNEEIDYATLVREEIIKTENGLFEKKESSGTRLVIAVVDGEMVHFANVGDAQAVIYYEKSKTSDDKIMPTNITRNSLRMLGDFQTKKGKPCEENDIIVGSYEILNSKFIILASETVWKVISKEQAVNDAKRNIMKEGTLVAARKLVESAYHKYISDDITVILIETRK